MSLPTEFNNKVHGFNLQLPYNSSSRGYPDSNGEWIEITKKPNELPTVKLRTIVLYHRNDGNECDANSADSEEPPEWDPDEGASAADNPNYRFYNDTTTGGCNGRQLGWIWGFPLFDVGRSAENWKRFESCTGDTDICGNQHMLVDISPQRNIIVLDWKGQNSATGYDKIKYKQDLNQIVESFYMTLRIKSSTENNINYTSGSIGQGKNGHWNLYFKNNKKTKVWATLIQYEYECDIIGPKSMLDFTFNRFMFNDTVTFNFTTYTNLGHPIYQGNWWWNPKRVLATPQDSGTSLSDAINTNYGSNSFVVKIITGNNNSQKRLYLSSIFSSLGYARNSATTYQYAQVKSRWNQAKSYTVTTLIGGWFNKGEGNNATERNIGYYGDNFGSGNRDTKMLATASTVTAGWKRFITLDISGTGNSWTNNYDTDTYEFNTILWFSLQSPRKLPVTKYTNAAINSFDQHRFITNFIDLSANTDNKIIGGGYGRYSNTIDMARESINPYYYSNSNDNTVDISGFNVNSDFNYLTSSSTALTLDDLNYFKVSYKLLVPPQNNETYDIKFNMGRSTGAVTTFVRFNDMSGVCIPSAGVGNQESNLIANRETESITLTWDKNAVDSSGNIAMNSIYFTDIASGFKKITPQFDISGGILSAANNPSTYDISFNVFQLHFFSRNGAELSTEREELPYTIKPFDTNLNLPQFIDISYVPLDYQPYRYINYNSGLQLYKANFPDSPLLIKNGISGETLKFNIGKWWTRDNGTRTNAKIIDPSNTRILPNINIDISYNNSIPVFDNSYSIIIATDLNQTDQGEATNEEIVEIGDRGNSSEAIENSEPQLYWTTPTNNSISFYEPQSLKLGSNFIPDYWRLPDKLNTLFMVNKTGIDGLITDPYHYYNTWKSQIQTNMVLDVLSIALKSEVNGSVQRQINYLLVNSNKSTRNTSEWDAITDNGTSINASTGNMVFEVQGANGLNVSQYLNKKPIIVQLSTITTGPFGVNSKAYIGDTAGGSTIGYPVAAASRGINVPYPEQTIGSVTIAQNDSNYVVNTFLPNTLRQGNGLGEANLSGLESGYNGKFNINLFAWNDGGSGIQNNSYNGTSISPTPLTVLIVDLSNVKQTNATSNEMINDENNAITIKWTSFYFSTLDASIWNKTELGDVFWTVTRYNLANGSNTVILNEQALSLNNNNNYTFTDTNVRVYDKFTYTVTGKFKWTGIQSLLAGSEIPSINVSGFTTPECFACKFNRFPYGRFNTTATNLKLYRPLLINTSSGQVNKFGEKVCGGGCSDQNTPGLNLFAGNTRISSSNNIYANTTNQVSKKQTYVILSKNRFRPFR